MPTAQQTALQMANPALGTVSRRPQSTAQSADTGVPFVRLSRRAKLPMYSIANQAFGALITQPLKAVGGYLRGFRLRVNAVGGTSTGAVVAAADAPWNLFASLYLRDPLGQPVSLLNGWDQLMVNYYGGQCGDRSTQVPSQLPSFSNVQLTSGAGAGNFQFELFIPLEFDSAAYCCLASMNASSQPSLAIQLAPSASVYTTPPTTLPTITITVTAEFWAVPVASPNLAPPSIGSSAQWSEMQAAPAIGSGGSLRVPWPRVGTYIHTLIAVLRDSTGARIAAFPANDLTLYVDGVPLMSTETYVERGDEIVRAFGLQAVLPTGVLVYTFRNSVQESVDSSDTHDVMLPTTPSTLLEIGGTWGAIANAPAQLTCITGELYPVDGVPYTHLAA